MNTIRLEKRFYTLLICLLMTGSMNFKVRAQDKTFILKTKWNMKKGEIVGNFNLIWNKHTFLFLLIEANKLRETNFSKKEELTELKWTSSMQLLMKPLSKRIKVWSTTTLIERYTIITKLNCWVKIIERFIILISNHRRIHM